MPQTPAQKSRLILAIETLRLTPAASVNDGQLTSSPPQPPAPASSHGPSRTQRCFPALSRQLGRDLHLGNSETGGPVRRLHLRATRVPAHTSLPDSPFPTQLRHVTACSHATAPRCPSQHAFSSPAFLSRLQGHLCSNRSPACTPHFRFPRLCDSPAQRLSGK